MHKDNVLIKQKQNQCEIIERFTLMFISCQDLIRAAQILMEAFSRTGHDIFNLFAFLLVTINPPAD